MKTKLTLTIEEDILPKAKQVAKIKCVSLSQLVEQSLKELINETPQLSFTSKWTGKLKLESKKSARQTFLEKRYL